MVSKEIKRMLAERRRAEEDSHDRYFGRRLPKPPADFERAKKQLWDRIDRAAPYINQGCSGWPTSALLKIQFCAVLTSHTCTSEKILASYKFVDDMLDRARELFVAGYIPNPFLDPPVLMSEL